MIIAPCLGLGYKWGGGRLFRSLGAMATRTPSTKGR